MKLLLQRVSRAKVTVEEKVIGEIDAGLLLFLGIHREDDATKIPWLVDKVCNLRVFEDEGGKMNRSVQDIGGKILLISQFTLYGDCRSGRRPSFTETMPPQEAEKLYEAFIQKLKITIGKESVATGQFGAYMQVDLLNDGPVTLLIEK